jgi:3''-5'' exonuclease.
VEIETLEYNDFQLDIDIKSTPPVPFVDANYRFVDTEESFHQMLEDLLQGNHLEIAVDLEHHSIRSYQGFTCLMQVIPKLYLTKNNSFPLGVKII